MSRPKTIMVDLDGVICTEERTFERPLAEPIDGAREALARLRAAGHTVIIYTARNWPEYRVTQKWLEEHGFQYDGLHMGKPVADVWIDDRAIHFTDWKQVLEQLDV
jgi:ribonucleotide monophosphatase NagD (HAD superfamily)